MEHEFNWNILKQEDFFGIGQDIQVDIMQKPIIYDYFKQTVAFIKVTKAYNTQEIHFWKADWPQYLAIAAAFNVFWLAITYLSFICIVRTHLLRTLIADLHPKEQN